MNNKWLEKNTFHYSDFKDLYALVDQKSKKNIKISLCLPTLNEEKTIAKEIIIMKSELMTRYPLLDEVVVIDSGSSDNTRAIAFKEVEVDPATLHRGRAPSHDGNQQISFHNGCAADTKEELHDTKPLDRVYSPQFLAVQDR